MKRRVVTWRAEQVLHSQEGMLCGVRLAPLSPFYAFWYLQAITRFPYVVQHFSFSLCKHVLGECLIICPCFLEVSAFYFRDIVVEVTFVSLCLRFWRKSLNLILKYSTITISRQKDRRKCYVTSLVIYKQKCLERRSRIPGAWLHPSGETVIFLLGVISYLLNVGHGRGAGGNF